MKSDTGLEYQIHISQELAGHGSILAMEQNMQTACRSTDDNKLLHLPIKFALDLMISLKKKNVKFAYMMSHPGDYMGKFSNFVSKILI